MRKVILIAIAILILQFQMVTYGATTRPSAAEIPVKSVIIGTYLIDYSMLEGQIIELAQATAEPSNQKRYYFKSDFTTKATWIDITDGESVIDLTDASDKAIANATIDALVLTHWVQLDGTVIVFDTSGAATQTLTVNTLVNLSDPRNNEALDKLEISKDLTDNQYASDSSLYNQKNILDAIFKTLDSSITADETQIMDMLDAFITKITDDNEMIALVKSLKDVLAAERAYQIDAALSARLEAQAENAVKYNLTALNEDIWAAIGTLDSEMTTLAAQFETDTSSVESVYRQVLMDEALLDIKSGMDDAARVVLTKLLNLDKLIAGLPPLDSDITEALIVTLISRAKAVVATDVKATMTLPTDEIASIQKLALEDAIEPLKKALTAYANFVLKGQAYDDQTIEGAIQALEGLKTAYTLDAAVIEVIDAQIDALLAGLRSQSAAEDAAVIAGLKTLEGLGDQLGALSNAYLSALDVGNLDLANEIKTEMNTLEAEIDALYREALIDYSLTQSQISALLGLLDDNADDELGLVSAANASYLLSGLGIDSIPAAELVLETLLGNLAKDILLLDPNDVAMLTFYEGRLEALEDAVDDGAFESIAQAYADYLEAYGMLSVALRDSVEYAEVQSQLIALAETAYLSGAINSGDSLLSLLDQQQDEMTSAEGSIEMTDEMIKVYIDAIKVGSTTYIPLKTFYALFGVETTWDASSRTAQIKGLTHTVTFTEGQSIAQSTNGNMTLDGPMIINAGKSYIPLSWVAADSSNYLKPSAQQRTLIIIPEE